ncbi:MAG TPA: HDOD domain-containing protein, partial [bacterium]|nr:HDOD domain-containing protein [bacterium]
VGKIALGTFVEEYLTRMQMYALENKVPFEEAERTIIGMDHAEAGAILLEQWSLPSCMINVVRWHQEPDRAPVQDLVIDLVHAADALMLSGGVGAGNDGLNYRLSRSVVSRLGVTIHVAEAVVCMTMSAVEELKDSFLGGSGR